MPRTDQSNNRDADKNKLILLPLVFSRYASITPTLILNLLLVDIAASYSSSVGVVGQLQTASSFVGFMGALLVAAISVRFGSATLLLAGLTLLALSAVGASFAPSLQTMLIFYTISGLANSIIPPMSSTLVGERFTSDFKSHAMSWLNAGMAFSGILGPPIINFILGLWGWRFVFLVYAFPLYLITLLLSAMALGNKEARKTIPSSSYLEGIRAIFSNRSAISCLIGSALSTAAYQVILLYAASFYRQRFMFSTGVVSIIILVGALFSTLGALVGAHLVNRFGRKPVSVLSALAAGISIILYTNMADPWLSIGAMYLGRFFSGVLILAVNLLTLEQIPLFRGSMMATSSAAFSLGSTLGAMTAGWILIVFGYEVIGSVLGTAMLSAAVVFRFFSIDPVKK